jgi:hypothetical protein
MSEENEEEEEEKKSYERRFKLDLSEIDVNTMSGQNKIITECQKALLTMELTPHDIKAISLLKDLVKAKKELDTLKMYIELKEEIEKLKQEMERKS